MSRYQRQISLPEFGTKSQAKLAHARVLVVGIGGLGCGVAQYLVAAGVAEIGLVDNDLVELSNLHRQVLYSEDDIGKAKVEIAARKLSGLNSEVKISTFQEKFQLSNALDLVAHYDLIIDCSDNFRTKFLVNDSCVKLGRTFVSAALLGFEGQIGVFNHKGSATLRCIFPELPDRGAVPNCAENGIIGVVPGVFACLQANEAIKIICEIGQPLVNRLLILNLASLSQKFVNYQCNNTEILRIKNSDLSYVDNYNLNNAACKEAGMSNNYKEIPVSEYLNWKDTNRHTLLDVREDFERAQDHIGGMHIALADLAQRAIEIPKESPLIIYCAHGMRSQRAAQYLAEQGFQNVFSLIGGLAAYREATNAQGS